MRLEQLSLNQATAETSSTLDVLAACQAAGIGQVSLWRHKYAGADPVETHRAVRDHGLSVSSLCRGGFFTGTRSVPEADQENRRAIEEAVALGAPVLVLVCGPVIDGDVAAAEAAILRGIERMLPAAIDAQITLAVEPFHPMFLAERSAIVTLAQANRLVERIGEPTVALAVDTYHVWWDPDLHTELERAAGRISAVHVADWLVPTPDLLAGRGLPGDGVIALPKLLAAIDGTGFTGPVEVEVLNADIWARPVHAVVRDVHERMQRLFSDLEPTTPPDHGGIRVPPPVGVRPDAPVPLAAASPVRPGGGT